jgi:transketolase
MRNAFAKQITQLAREDERIVVLSGDIGNRLFDELKAQCPDGFSCAWRGEHDQDSRRHGAGRLRPVCYTITPFVTYRCLEQSAWTCAITGAGGDRGHRLRAFVRFTARRIIRAEMRCPVATRLAVVARGIGGGAGGDPGAVKHPGPVYLRSGRRADSQHAGEPPFAIGRAIPVREGKEVFADAGTLLPVALATADLLQASGRSTGVYSFHTIKPPMKHSWAKRFEVPACRHRAQRAGRPGRQRRNGCPISAGEGAVAADQDAGQFCT